MSNRNRQHYREGPRLDDPMRVAMTSANSEEAAERLKQRISEGRALLGEFRDVLREATQVKQDIETLLTSASARGSAILAPYVEQISNDIDRLSNDVTHKLKSTADELAAHMLQGMAAVGRGGELAALRPRKLSTALQRGEGQA